MPLQGDTLLSISSQEESRTLLLFLV